MTETLVCKEWPLRKYACMHIGHFGPIMTSLMDHVELNLQVILAGI